MKLTELRPKIRIPWGIDWSLFIIPLVLSFVGIVLIFSVTYATDPTNTISQIIYVAVGFAVAIGLTFFDYRNLRGLSTILYIVLIVLLLFVLIFGREVLGSSRWINLGFFKLQPSELGKLIVAIVLAWMFAEEKVIDWKRLLTIFGLVALPVILTLMQPDFGTSVVIFTILMVMLLASKVKKTILLVVLAAMLVAAPIGWHFLKPYQKDRIYTFIDPSRDPYGTGYNVTQAKITVGSGGIFGSGIGEGTQIQLNFLPVAQTDFIFATAAESVGLVGSTLLILLLISLVMRIINVAKVSKDYFGYYFGLGWGLTLLIQTFINVGMNLGIAPVTGIPLPFVSQGGSSMLVNMAAIGILQSIYLRHRKITFS